MTLQVLASAMNAAPQELISKMNISSDCLIINQCGHYGYEELTVDGHTARFFHGGAGSGLKPEQRAFACRP